ncbi:MAG: replication endonuclease [Pseudomonadaceae bacterium]|nr:replication endonuclease [Pseudomonadaceae bacterium]
MPAKKTSQYQAPALNVLITLDLKELNYVAWRIANKHIEAISRLKQAEIVAYANRDHEYGVNVSTIDSCTAENQIKRLANTKFWRTKVSQITDLQREHKAMCEGRLGLGKELFCSDRTFNIQEEREIALTSYLASQANKDPFGGNYNLAEIINSANRRRVNEYYLLTKAMEQLALKRDFKWMMLTLSCPPNYHSNPEIGQNSFSGETPDSAYNYLNALWRKIQKHLGKNYEAYVDYFGLRVTEVHLDGCPHWHVLLFFRKGLEIELEKKLRNIFNKEGLRPKNHFEENKEKIIGLAREEGSGLAKISSPASYMFKYLAFALASDGKDLTPAQTLAKRHRCAIRAVRKRAVQPIGMEGILEKLRLVKSSLTSPKASEAIKRLARNLVVSKDDPGRHAKQLMALTSFIDVDHARLEFIRETYTNRYGDELQRNTAIRLIEIRNEKPQHPRKGAVALNYTSIKKRNSGSDTQDKFLQKNDQINLSSPSKVTCWLTRKKIREPPWLNF